MPSIALPGRKKKGKGAPTVNLGPNLSFLQVIQDACHQGGRYTLTAESNGLSYTVLVDRGGPFNASGGGVTGSAALAMAAALRSGTYTVTDGWPVDQPLYQLGLDATLKNLLLGSPRSETAELPPARGVDAIRNDAWRDEDLSGHGPETTAAGPSAFPSAPWLDPDAPARMIQEPEPEPSPASTFAFPPLPPPRPLAPEPPPAPVAPEPLLAPEPTRVTESPAVSEFSIPDPAAPQKGSQVVAPELFAEPAAPEVSATPVAPEPPIAEAPASQPTIPTPTVAAPVVPEPTVAEPPATQPEAAPPALDMSGALASAGATGTLRDLAGTEDIDVDPGAPGEPGASEKQGKFKHLLTQALCWTVQVEEPGRYTLGQAWVLTRRATRASFAFMIDPVEREILKRWSQARDDWKSSGESVAKQKPRKRRKP